VLNENIVRSLSSGLLTIDRSGVVLFANPTATEILGLTEIVGKPSSEILPGVDEHLDDTGGPERRFEIALARPDGRDLYLGLSCSPLRDERGRSLGHVINFQDVTRVRDLQRRVRRNERLAAIGSLAASVAHEVRNPLAAIAGSAELLAGSTPSADDRRLLAVIQREAERLNLTVSALLDYTSPRAPQWSRVDLGALCRDVAAAFAADPANARIELALEIGPGVSATADASQLSQVLWNLLRNARDAIEGPGRIRIGASTRGHGLTLTVADDGVGMDAATVDRLFEPFFSTKKGGSGIGLAVVHRVVEEHGGSIGVRSAPGEGTEFVIELPPGPEVSGLFSVDRLDPNRRGQAPELTKKSADRS
jgi:two-component system sensor histidine kinase PilS (NtrC family)